MSDEPFRTYGVSDSAPEETHAYFELIHVKTRADERQSSTSAEVKRVRQAARGLLALREMGLANDEEIISFARRLRAFRMERWGPVFSDGPAYSDGAA